MAGLLLCQPAGKGQGNGPLGLLVCKSGHRCAEDFGQPPDKGPATKPVGLNRGQVGTVGFEELSLLYDDHSHTASGQTVGECATTQPSPHNHCIAIEISLVSHAGQL